MRTLLLAAFVFAVTAVTASEAVAQNRKKRKKIEQAGYTIGIQTRLAWTFSGPAELTLYPSGKLLVKTEDKELAAQIAQSHVKEWVRA